MQFEKVTELKSGTKYKVVYCKRLTYAATYLSTEGEIRLFENVNKFYGDIMPRKCIQQNISGNHHQYFVPIFQKERIQSNMEHRAVNLILQRITGDPTFSW